MSNDLGAFCMPDFSKCGEGAGKIGEHLSEAINHFTAMKWFDFTETGTKSYAQDPCFMCPYNVPLMIGTWCVPCCLCATHLRDMEKMTGDTCESQCLTCCILNCICYTSICYYAKKRGEWRKKYDIKGSEGMDCLGFCCCSACMICQDANQIMHEDSTYRVPYCSEVVEGATQAPKPAEAAK